MHQRYASRQIHPFGTDFSPFLLIGATTNFNQVNGKEGFSSRSSIIYVLSFNFHPTFRPIFMVFTQSFFLTCVRSSNRKS